MGLPSGHQTSHSPAGFVFAETAPPPIPLLATPAVSAPPSEDRRPKPRQSPDRSIQPRALHQLSIKSALEPTSVPNGVRSTPSSPAAIAPHHLKSLCSAS